MGFSVDEQYDRAKRRRRMDGGYRPGPVRPAQSQPGHCWHCSAPLLWGQLPDGRWLALDPETSGDGRYAALPGQRTIEVPLGATTTPEVQRHHAHRTTCGGGAG